MNRRSFIAASSSALLGLTLGARATAKEPQALHVPPEDAPHEATFMQWPVNRDIHPDRDFLNALQQTIADIANTIAAFEPVIMLAAKAHHSKARRYLSNTITLWDIPTDDLWCRDSGPLFARNQSDQLVVSHVQFNGWGNKQIHTHDRTIAKHVAEQLGIEMMPSGLVGEAGGVEHDGHGLLIAHESSWVNANRNPGMTRATIEAKLLDTFGAERMIWSPGVVGQDITDYHIDSLARFTGPKRLLLNLPSSPDPTDPFHRAALESHDRYQEAGLHIDVIPEPTLRRIKSQNFVASYANFYVCNNAVLVAQFGDSETDSAAISALQQHYPGREIIDLNVDALGEIGGGIHCATQQMPSLRPQNGNRLKL